MPQINELTTRTFDGDSLIGFDVENTDPQTQAQYPYVTGKADGNALADFIANEQEYVTDLNTVDKHINGAINELHAINGYSYDAYDDTATYSVDDLCIYNNALYKCTTAITTAEAWNASHWTATSIADEISELNTGKQDIIPDTVAKTVTFDVTPSGGEVKAKVYNRVLYVSGYFRFSANQSANTQLLHISDITLAMEVFESCFTDGSSTVRFKLTTDGKLINENQFQANQWVSISLACLLA